MKIKIIWNYDLSDYDRDEMKGVYEECCDETPSDELLEEYIQDTNNDYLDDIRAEIECHEKNHDSKTYVIIGNLGLWYGRVEGGKIIEGLWNSLRQCFEDYNKIYEENGRLKVTAHHHDGTNFFQIKELTKRGEDFAERHKWDMSDRELHKKLFNDSHYSRNVRMFKELYGW